MNDTETRTATGNDFAPKYVEMNEVDRCPVCGIQLTGFDPAGPYAHNTCSQDCARTAAIVEAINGPRHAAMPTYTITHTEPDGNIDWHHSADSA